MLLAWIQNEGHDNSAFRSLAVILQLSDLGCDTSAFRSMMAVTLQPSVGMYPGPYQLPHDNFNTKCIFYTNKIKKKLESMMQPESGLLLQACF